MGNHQEQLQIIVDSAKKWQVGQIGGWRYGYMTAGNTYIIATDPRWNDNGLPKDLVAILPGKLENGTRVIPLHITVAPDLIEALRAELDGGDN